jgi:hypothetical protein
MVCRREAGATPESRYANAGPAAQVFSREVFLVGILRSEELASADQIRVTANSRRDHAFELAVEIRRFTGDLGANVVTVAFVEMDLGALEPGDYEFAAEVITLQFDQYGHPETASNPSRQDYRVEFQVR